MADRNTFGWRVSEARRGKGLIQRELCQLIQEKHSLDIDYQFYSKIEVNRVDIQDAKFDSLVKAIASVLDINLEELEELRKNFQIAVDDPNAPHIACQMKRQSVPKQIEDNENQFNEYRGFAYRVTSPIFEGENSRLARGNYRSRVIGYCLTFWKPNGTGG